MSASKKQQCATSLSAGSQQSGAHLSMGKPRGFRDILFSEAARREKLVTEISAYFAAAGYELIETPSVEYPETLLRGMNSELNSASSNDSNLRDTFRFVDVDGNLIALRSDVTGALARVVATRFSLVDPPYRLRYVADIFQEQESLRGSDRQLTQLGLECFGLSAEQADQEVLCLALGGAAQLGLEQVKLYISDVTVMNVLVEKIVESLDSSEGQRWRQDFFTAWRNGDLVKAKDLARFAQPGGVRPDAPTQALVKLLSLRGGTEVLDEAARLVAGDKQAIQALSNLRKSYDTVLAQLASAQEVVVDFSLAPQLEYYSGLIFEINAVLGNGRSCRIGSGGRYDSLMERFGRKLPAAGFGYDLASLERTVASFEYSNTSPSEEAPLRIAIPKGKLYDDCIDMLAQAGIDLPELREPGRSLMFSNAAYEVIIAKPSDVAIYVSRGAADVGISGRDTLVEADFPLLQLIDLEFGGCEFVVAAPESMDSSLDELSLQLGTIRVATKYPRLTQKFFDKRGIQVEIVKLNGNIELAPMIGIADLVVDLSQTGTTLRENNLRIVETVLPSTARFVAQHSAARSDTRVLELAEKLERIVRSNCDAVNDRSGS